MLRLSIHSPEQDFTGRLFQGLPAPTEVMVPWNEPEVKPVVKFTKRSTVKLPLAPANRPVPPVMVLLSSTWKTSGGSANSACPTTAAKDAVAVGRDEVIGPDSRIVLEVHRRFPSHRKLAKVGGDSRAVPIDQ